MISLKRILVPTDFSTYSACAREHACALAEKFGSEVHLLNVVQDIVALVPEPGMAFSTPTVYLEELREAAQGALDKVLDVWEAGGRKVVRTISQGVPFLEILNYAREHDIDLIVMATHGRAGLAHALLGSVTEKIVRKARCPVLTIRPTEHEFKMP